MVFDLPDSYIENKKTGERIAIRWEGSSPVIDLKVLTPVESDRALLRATKELTPLDEEPEPSLRKQQLMSPDSEMQDANAAGNAAPSRASADFRRQAQQL